MTYIVTENCIKCKFMDCVEVCPVDCYYEGENFLVINPDGTYSFTPAPGFVGPIDKSYLGRSYSVSIM